MQSEQAVDVRNHFVASYQATHSSIYRPVSSSLIAGDRPCQCVGFMVENVTLWFCDVISSDHAANGARWVARGLMGRKVLIHIQHQAPRESSNSSKKTELRPAHMSEHALPCG